MSDITVIQQTQRIIVDGASGQIASLLAGPVGPPGAPGPSAYIGHVRLPALSEDAQEALAEDITHDVTGMSITFMAAIDHFYEVTFYLPYVRQEVAGGEVRAYITDGSNNIKVYSNRNFSMNTSSFMFTQWIASGLSGSQTFKGRITTSGGTLNLGYGYTAPCFTIKDLGVAP